LINALAGVVLLKDRVNARMVQRREAHVAASTALRDAVAGRYDSNGMTCSVCGASNPENAKFCGSCGAVLAAVCSRCGEANPPQGRFCLECGAALVTPSLESRFASPRAYTPPRLADKIRAGSAEIEGARKQITVLFADVAGFTSISERLDPEDTHVIMRRCFDLMLGQVHTYEGTVSQLLGDGMLALFGAPIAHEDHAQRAIRAALGVQHALKEYQEELAARGIDFRIRIGINSGPVVVGSVGVDLTMSYQAVGDTVNVASRMEGLAPPGGVVVSENTYRLVSGYFQVRELGAHDIKGKDKPIEVYEVLRASRSRSRVDVHAEQGLAAFVGRRDELDAIVDRFNEARMASGQVVFVSGEAGLGKSRLVYELRHRLEDEEVVWLVGRCSSYGSDISYLPIIDLLKDAFQIEETDNEEEIARKIEGGTSVISPGREHLPLLKYLLSVDPGDDSVTAGDPQIRKARIFEALRAVLVAASSERPLVLVVEDLHWVDRLSAELLSYVCESIPEHRLLLVLTHRPEWDPPFGHRPHFTTLELRTLSKTDSARIAGTVLGVEGVPRELSELIYRKAEGNPFFVEEVARSLLEAGVIRRSNSHYELARPIEEIFVPDTVQDVIMARLDRLPEESRRALQTASVIGREFTARLLDRTAALGGSDESLNELRAVELIYEHSLYPELEYMFKHALTHDVAYNSLLLDRRRVLHGVVGDAIEELYTDRLPEHYERLAYHFEQADRPDKAFTYLIRAAQKSLAAFAPAQAVEFFERALAFSGRENVAAGPEQLMALHFGLGQALSLLSRWDESLANYEGMRALARSLGDPVQEGVAQFNAAICLFWAHRFEEAMEVAERARTIGIEQGNDTVQAGALLTIEGVYSVTGDLVTAREVTLEASRVASRSEVPTLQGITAVWRGFYHHWTGDETGALEQWREGAEIGREHQIPIVQLWTLWTLGLALLGQGRYDEALVRLHEHLDLTTRLGDKVFRCRTLNTLGWAYMDLLNWDLAIEYNRRGLEESRAVGDPEIIRNAALNLGDCYLAFGELDEAQEILETVDRESQATDTWGEQWMKWRYSQHASASLGELWLARGDIRKAMSYAEDCVKAAETTQSKRNITKSRRLRGEGLLALGKPQEARTEIEAALVAAREVGNPAQTWKTLAARARAIRAVGESADAIASYAEAIAVIEATTGGLSDAGLRETMLGSETLGNLRTELAGTT
jgi:class 3 adenylate cyclase/tetratricopeptide (TPR) repeat protein